MRALDRIGGALLAPRSTFAEVARQRAGGLPEAAALAGLAALLMAARDVVFAVRLGAQLGLQPALSRAVGALLAGLAGPGLVALACTIAITAFGRGERAQGRDLDLGALAAVPFVVLRVLGALLELALDHSFMRICEYIGLAWTGLACLQAVRAVRA